MTRIAMFIRMGKPYDDVKTRGRPWLAHLKTKIVSPDLSVYYYIKFMYPDVKIMKFNRKNFAKINDYKFDRVFAGWEELTLPFMEFAKKDDKIGYNKFVKDFKNVQNLFPKFKYIEFITDKCKYYAYLKKNGIPVAPTKCFKSRVYKYIKQHAFVNDKTKVFMKPTPGGESKNTGSFTRHNSSLENYISTVAQKKYDKLVVQPYLQNFATKKHPELRTYWINKQFQYTISTTGKGFDWKRIDTKPSTYILNKSIKILRLLETKFKQSSLLTRIDWGYDRSIGFFVNEIEYSPGLFTEMFKNGGTDWKLDIKIGDQMIRMVR